MGSERAAGENRAELGGGEAGPYRGLLIDHGGVLTTSPFESFRAFCELKGLGPDAIAERFGLDRQSRRLLIELETGRIDEAEFEPRFARMLGGEDAEHLIDRLSAGSRPTTRWSAP